ncbi:MAG: hypothetical protein LUG91_04625 [Ruminococcus sp.]|nr:hypothetical protein [Ruminococcus sp.]
MKLIPFAVIKYEDIRFDIMVLSLTEEEHKDRDIILYFESPDEIYGFKNARINVDKMIIISREGYTDEEMKRIIQICRDNVWAINKISREGIIYAQH